ncbi:hypothetical protein J0X15_19030 [Roseibium sp. CAU 1637]|uniref:TNase-like domain-containing protein n=1 Tax=Roseibium limicola TaxID=2816037 RepID=A0A939JAD9_9HYPH|nr:hypothetical protein [Roseibium limicola]MBO0347331.1 hypothetical protein [Roseibium limicola]
MSLSAWMTLLLRHLSRAALLALLVTSSNVSGAQGPETARQRNVDAPLRWTTKPMRVDRAEQDLPRIEDRRKSDPFPDILYVPPSVRTPDSVTFQVDGTIHRLAYLAPVPSQKVCVEETGRKWACGLRARMALRTLIAGKQIRCKSIAEGEDAFKIVHCELAVGRSLAEELLKAGAAVGSGVLDDDLGAMERQARTSRSGIWADSQFSRDHPERSR